MPVVRPQRELKPMALEFNCCARQSEHVREITILGKGIAARKDAECHESRGILELKTLARGPPRSICGAAVVRQARRHRKYRINRIKKADSQQLPKSLAHESSTHYIESTEFIKAYID